jgi:hypothetical protein
MIGRASHTRASALHPHPIDVATPIKTVPAYPIIAPPPYHPRDSRQLVTSWRPAPVPVSGRRPLRDRELAGGE